MSENYEIDATDYGMRLALRGFANPAEIGEMNREMERIISRLDEGFGVLVDMRATRAFSAEVAELLKGQIEMCKARGMARGAVILQSAIATLQARRITSEAGIAPQVRFIDASSDPAWEETAIAWAQSGQEPPERMMGGKAK